MNKKCIIKNGIGIVKDEYDSERQVINCDNLDDILVQENLIENIQNVLKILENSSSSFLENKSKDILCIPLPLMGTILVPSVLMYMTNIPNNSILTGMIHTKFGLMTKEKFLAIFIAIFLPYGFSATKKWYEEYSDDKKSESGRILAIKELKSDLLIQKNILKEMNERSVPIELCEEKSYTIDDAEKLAILYEHISLYYDIGYNFKTYYRYYRKNGDVPESFKQEYNEDGIKLMRELLGENSKSLIKKIKSK